MKAVSLLVLLFLLSACGSGSGEKEPNNSLATAQPIPIELKLSGKIGTSGDRDFYTFSAPEGAAINRYVSLTLEHPASVDLLCNIYYQGKLVKTINDWAAKDSRSGRHPVPRTKTVQERMANLTIGPGRYHVEVRLAGKQKLKRPLQYRLLLVPGQLGKFSELEPNDQREHAQQIEVGMGLEGYFSPAANPLLPGAVEVDWYKLEVDSTNRQLLDVALSGVPEVDAVLAVYDSEGRLLARPTDSLAVHREEKISRLGITGSGSYYIKVYSKRPYMGNPDLPYSLLVTTHEYQAGHELEANDSIKQANPLAVNTNHTGYLHPEKDLDFYKFLIPQPGRYMFSARAKGVPNVDLALALYDEQGALLKKFNIAGVNEPEFIANYSIRARRHDQPFYLCLEALQGANSQEPYQVNISFHETGWQGEEEPNDSANKANRLSLGVDRMGYLFPQGDQDYYTFSIRENSRVSIRVGAIVGVDLVLALFAPSGKLLATANKGKAGKQETLSRDLPGPGSYRIRVSAPSAGQFNAQQPYALRVRAGKPHSLPQGQTPADNLP